MTVPLEARRPILEQIRGLCLSLPETTARPSHGSPTYFVRGKRAFVTYQDNHHGDGRLAIWCAAPPGMQRVLVDAEPEHYFMPPYVGYRGWVGLRLDRSASSEEIATMIGEAYRAVAPRSLVAESRPGDTGERRPGSRVEP